VVLFEWDIIVVDHSFINLSYYIIVLVEKLRILFDK